VTGGLLERLGVGRPVVQAGMGGGIAAHELAAAVSAAGGLGTIGIFDPGDLRHELEAARRLTDRPIAVNILLPFARPGHWEVAADADVVTTFWGRISRPPRARCWIHQCGSVEEAREAHAAGADAVIAQGVEAGGHVRGTTPALELLERVRAELPDDFPVLVAGGIATREDVARVVEHGGEAAVLGTRFVMSDESRAHPVYKDRLRSAHETLLTELFGLGWPDAPHRVVPNAATDSWLRDRGRPSAAIRALERAVSPLLGRLSLERQTTLAHRASRRLPLSPAPALADGPARLVEATPLYAGESVARITDVRPASRLVDELTPA
jgi:nitronate monooxygenase